MADRDTIFALSSGRPPAAIAVVRISGPRAGEALKALAGKIPAPRQATFVRVRDPESKTVIDEALALFFPAPRSETGEDVAELQLHGGRAVIAATLAALGKLESLRPAEAGEFTRRAFENGKLDLTAVEGLADLVMAETEGQRAQALRQMQGALRGRVESWRERLIKALALTEARIDFADEADVPEHLIEPARAIARELASEIAAALADDKRGERLREGLTVAITGPPNAGKSTLLNRIARREAAIVSPYAGTTRDVIEVHLDLAGWPVTLLDTAGIRDTEDPVEMEGVRRARERAAAADLVLWVVDASAVGSLAVIPEAACSAAVRNPEAATVAEIGSERRPGLLGIGDKPAGEHLMPPAEEALARPPIWLIRNKIDLVSAVRRNESKVQYSVRSESSIQTNEGLKDTTNKGSMRRSERRITSNEFGFDISATTGAGFEALLGALARQAESFLAGAEPALVTRARHRRVLEETMAALHRALSPEMAMHEDLLAEELRLAARALARATGRVDVEDILDVIFRDFCIGK